MLIEDIIIFGPSETGNFNSSGSILIRASAPVMLFQIVMVSPGTCLVKYHDSQSRTNESQVKKKKKENEPKI